MSTKRLYIDYLNDMLSHAEKAERFAQGVNFLEFQRNEEKLFAVVRALEVIGEAARHIPKFARDKYPEMPWQKIVGMRDKVIHEYMGVDEETVWRTVQEDLPPLKTIIRKMLNDLREE
jgi:uncharacterized protein with HEPN domain